MMPKHNHTLVTKKIDAIRRISLCHAGAKMVSFNFNLLSDQPPNHTRFDKLMLGILEPNKERPARAAEAEGNIANAINPLTGQKIDPKFVTNNLDPNVNHQWSVMQSITALPVDGNINLFGDHGVGLLLDMRFCNFFGEAFVFSKEAMTANDWWLRTDEKSMALRTEFVGMHLNNLIKQLKLDQYIKETREYSEQLVGLNRRSIIGIVLQPNKDLKPQQPEKYAELFNAIDIKISASKSLNKVLPIIMISPHTNPGVTEYTIEQQNIDLIEYLSSNPNHPKRELLLNFLKFNIINSNPETEKINETSEEATYLINSFFMDELIRYLEKSIVAELKFRSIEWSKLFLSEIDNSEVEKTATAISEKRLCERYVNFFRTLLFASGEISLNNADMKNEKLKQLQNEYENIANRKISDRLLFKLKTCQKITAEEIETLNLCERSFIDNNQMALDEIARYKIKYISGKLTEIVFTVFSHTDPLYDQSLKFRRSIMDLIATARVKGNCKQNLDAMIDIAYKTTESDKLDKVSKDILFHLKAFAVTPPETEKDKDIEFTATENHRLRPPGST